MKTDEQSIVVFGWSGIALVCLGVWFRYGLRTVGAFLIGVGVVLILLALYTLWSWLGEPSVRLRRESRWRFRLEFTRRA